MPSHCRGPLVRDEHGGERSVRVGMSRILYMARYRRSEAADAPNGRSGHVE